MNENQNSKASFTKIELKMLALDQYRKANGSRLV